MLCHALLLSVQFDGGGTGWLGLAVKFRERRVEAPALRVLLARPSPVDLPQEPMPDPQLPMPHRIRDVALTTPAPSSAFSAQAISAASPGSTNEPAATESGPPARIKLAERKGEAVARVAPTRAPETKPDVATAPVEESPKPVPADPVTESFLTSNSPNVPNSFAVPSTPSRDVSAAQDAAKAAEEKLDSERREIAKADAARAEALRMENERKEQARIASAKLELQRLETARLLAERQDVERREAARVEAARAEAAKIETARIEAERIEAARTEAARVESARQEALRQEAQRLEAARVEALRLEATRAATAQREAQRLEAARRESERLEVARQAAAKVESTRMQEERDEDAQREARRRNMARILEEEAAQRESAKFAASKPILPLSLSSARRVRLWGRADPNEALVNYAEAWARRIQLNTLPEVIKGITRAKPSSPMVTVAVRSDGTIESVTFVVSSGAPDIDEAIRRIVHSHAPYPPFPPELSRDFDVVEIRRTWIFDVAVRLQ